ncbi:flagellar motor protein MotB [Synergistales bacterium]|nr:flagellar motor protein MotB [Synergistales bacterium]
MARKKKDGGSTPGAPLWVATYGDMVTLLLCFFVLLFSMSSLDAKKFSAMAESMQLAFKLQGGDVSSTTKRIEGGMMLDGTGETKVVSDANETQKAKQVLALVQESLKTEMEMDDIKVVVDERGIIISVSEQTLFDEGSARLRPESKRILYKIGGVLKQLPNQIAIEGHTDSGIPVNSIYYDNWGLSAARAARVTSYMNEEVGVSAARLKAIGMGAMAPVVPNDTEAHKILNRRVEVVIESMLRMVNR